MNRTGESSSAVSLATRGKRKNPGILSRRRVRLARLTISRYKCTKDQKVPKKNLIESNLSEDCPTPSQSHAAL